MKKVLNENSKTMSHSFVISDKRILRRVRINKVSGLYIFIIHSIFSFSFIYSNL